MTDTVRNVLFVCTHNSARSILAEGLLNGLAGGRFRGYSAGSQPKAAPNPLALETLSRLQMPADGYRSKDWDEFARPGAPRLDFIFTVCDSAAGEACPIWPGHPATEHWGVADPSAVQGSREEQLKAFFDTAMILKRRIELLLALPLAALDRSATQAALRDIGQQG
jgi:arsenate reductase (thioredoxin)